MVVVVVIVVVVGGVVWGGVVVLWCCGVVVLWCGVCGVWCVCGACLCVVVVEVLCGCVTLDVNMLHVEHTFCSHADEPHLGLRCDLVRQPGGAGCSVAFLFRGI